MNTQLRLWRSLACCLFCLLVLALALPAGSQRWTPPPTTDQRLAALEQRIAALEQKLATVSAQGNTLTVTGNLRVVNGTGRTDQANGSGNLQLGYNEPRGGQGDNRTGSHCLVIGKGLNYTACGTIVSGTRNTTGAYGSACIGGQDNAVVGEGSATVAGMNHLVVNGGNAAVGGAFNTIFGWESVICGGQSNYTNLTCDAISGGVGAHHYDPGD